MRLTMMFKNIIDIKLISCFHFLKQHISQRFINNNVMKNTTRADFRMAPNVFRQKKTYSAVVQEVRNASSSIKILRLLVKEQGFFFKAGQWVDFFVPGISEVTGYSMTSPPNEAKEKGILELSVKYGKFPPTHWVHTQCIGGEVVHIRVGGDFFYDPFSSATEAEADLLLVGGGVGINPLVSILLEYVNLLHTTSLQNDNSIKPGKVHLLYSGRTEEELVFKDTFMTMEKEYPSLTCQYFVTREESEPKRGIKYCRIEKQDVINSISTLQPQKTVCYVCGPSTMSDDVANWLYELGIKKEYIRYEKWW